MSRHTDEAPEFGFGYLSMCHEAKRGEIAYSRRRRGRGIAGQPAEFTAWADDVDRRVAELRASGYGDAAEITCPICEEGPGYACQRSVFGPVMSEPHLRRVADAQVELAWRKWLAA